VRQQNLLADPSLSQSWHFFTLMLNAVLHYINRRPVTKEESD